MKPIRIVFIVIAALILIGLGWAIDWQQPGSRENLGPWLTATSAVLLIISMVVSERQERGRM